MDPFKIIADNVYIEYSKSNLKYDPYWRLKKINCPVCDCYIVYPRGHAHKYTKKHEKNLRKYTVNILGQDLNNKN